MSDLAVKPYPMISLIYGSQEMVDCYSGNEISDRLRINGCSGKRWKTTIVVVDCECRIILNHIEPFSSP